MILKSKNHSERQQLEAEKTMLESNVTTLEAEQGKKAEEEKSAKGKKSALERTYTDAKTQYDARKKETDGKKNELAKLVAEVDSILEAKRKVESAQDAFPKSVDEAQRQWTIHVKVDLGEGK